MSAVGKIKSAEIFTGARFAPVNIPGRSNVNLKRTVSSASRADAIAELVSRHACGNPLADLPSVFGTLDASFSGTGMNERSDRTSKDVAQVKVISRVKRN